MKTKSMNSKSWKNVMLVREDRVNELKKEVNELLEQLGKQKKYHSDTNLPAVPISSELWQAGNT